MADTVWDSRGVIDALLRGKPAPRVGLFDSPWSDTLPKWVTQGYPSNAEGKPVDPIDHFGFDLAGVGGWFDILPLRDFKQVEKETDEWKIVRNGAGAALKWWKNKSGTPEHIDFRMTSRQVWDRDYRPHLLQVDRGRYQYPGRPREPRPAAQTGPVDLLRPPVHLGEHASEPRGHLPL